MDKFSVTVHSDLEHENLLAEVEINGQFVGLVTNEPGDPVAFEIPQGEVKFQSLDLDVFIAALIRARKELLQE